jgi:type III restriction enzyme
VYRPVVITLPEKPDLGVCPKPLRAQLSWEARSSTLTIAAPLCEDETAVLRAAVASEAAAVAIAAAAESSRTTAIEFFPTPSELGERFLLPQLALRVLIAAGEDTASGASYQTVLFDDPELLDYPWELSPYDAAPTREELSVLDAGLKVAEGGEIDVDTGSGRVITRFLPRLQRDLGLVYEPEHWDVVRLAAWLCRNLPDPTLTHVRKQAFVLAWLTELLARPGFTLGRANLQKFQLRDVLEGRIRHTRRQAARLAFQQQFFGEEAAARVAVDEALAFEFHPQAYAPARDYLPAKSAYGCFDFRKHYYGRIGDFDSREEFECACWLDIQAQQGRLAYWVRNLVRREGSSFFLQKADGRFYPDFLCRLPETDGQPGPVLAVEYKGADRWDAAADDRQIGDLWAELSGGRCRFVMLKERRWEWIDAHLPAAATSPRTASP